MALDINNIKQASPKANQVATEQYVDTSIANIDVSGDINTNNDLLAQKLGYLNYESMVSAASSGNTIVNGGYINTSLIKANAINANQINTSGLIAEDIITTTLTGKILNGSVINGAVINGAVVRASYLDLDGELEVLTNYHITPAMYNANPSLYTDAVYMSGTNEWRIPSISTVREANASFNITSANSTFNSLIRSYNCGISGKNIKSVKIRPTITVSPFEFLSIKYSYSNQQYSATNTFTGQTDTYSIYFAGFHVGDFKYRFYNYYGTSDIGLYRNGSQVTSSGTTSYSITINSYIFVIDIVDNQGVMFNGSIEIKARIANVDNYSNTLSVDFTDTNKGLLYIKNSGGGSYGFMYTGPTSSYWFAASCKTIQSLYINNMI